MARTRIPLRILHVTAAVVGFVTIASFVALSAAAELFAGPASIAAVKAGIVRWLFLLVPALALAGASGFFLAGKRPKGLAAVKFARMRLIGTNGLCVLVPCALFLAWKAGQGAFDPWFAAVQALEFGAGAANLVLMALNMRDGLAMKGRIARQRPRCMPR